MLAKFKVFFIAMMFAILVINTKLLYEKLTIAIDSGLKAIYDSVIVVFPLKMLIERIIYV